MIGGFGARVIVPPAAGVVPFTVIVPPGTIAGGRTTPGMVGDTVPVVIVPAPMGATGVVPGIVPTVTVPGPIGATGVPGNTMPPVVTVAPMGAMGVPG
jgi:hypothetical protein